ncbi:LOW QUALITY PROTEIN: A-kinase anchor protein 3 [Sarcoramphus papa]
MMVGILCYWEVIHGLKPDQAQEKEDYHEKSRKLSNLVIAVAHKEINENSDGPDPCFAVLGKPSHKSVGLGTNKDKNNPSANVTHVNARETKYEESSSSKIFYKERSQSSNRNELFQKRRVGQQEKKKCHKHFGQDEFANNLSKEILIYANNVVSVMVVSVMKTMEGQANDSNIACVVLNLLLKHAKAMVSDLIDSCLKNLHDITGKLLTNSDFSSSVKLTLFTLASRKAAEIVQAMLNHFHSTLIVQKPEGDRLAYASVKTGSRTDAKAQMRSAATRTETLPKEKEMTCADAVGNHIIKQGFTLWHENQNQYTEQSCEEAVSGLTKMLTDQLDLSREDSSSAQFIGSLVDTVLKVCLTIVKYSNPELLLAESGSREDHLLQNPVMENLQKLSSVAVEKGYKVGEILQTMLKYEKERQSGEAVGVSVQLPVLNWLLNNS